MPMWFPKLASRRERLRREIVEEVVSRLTNLSNDDLHRAMVEDVIRDMLQPVNARGQPNLNPLQIALRNRDITNLNLKFFGYDLARSISRSLAPSADTSARYVGLESKASTQADMESDWVAHWCAELLIPVVMHRKLWELSYVLQAIYDHGSLREGARGLGFGCGEEPLPSYLASHGVRITVTDLDAGSPGSEGWARTGQHTVSLDKAYQPRMIDRDAFDRLVVLQYVDMNAIPDTLVDYDFCWSVCALEHLGSIAKGLDFIENSLKAIRAGGVAVHTTEFNVAATGPTLDNWPSVLFQRSHLGQLAERLRANGHQVAELNFDLGNQPLDKFIDLPPWGHDVGPEFAQWHSDGGHLKVAADGFVSTCFGIIVTKAG